MSDKETNKPPVLQAYMVPGLIQYIIDCGEVPYLTVVVNDPDIQVPSLPHAVQKREIPAFDQPNSQIVGLLTDVLILDVHPSAISKYTVTPDGISFLCRFNRMQHSLYLPFDAIVAIRAKSSPQDMNQWAYNPARLNKLDFEDSTPPADPVKPRPTLTRVK